MMGAKGTQMRKASGIMKLGDDYFCRLNQIYSLLYWTKAAGEVLEFTLTR